MLAGLGAGLDQSHRLPEDAREKTLAALRRFRLLLNHMKVAHTRVVATAAVRDAEDGVDFVREIESIGLTCEVLTAEDEALLAGQGVLSGIPDADGIVGDLGGGSLELVDVSDGTARDGISLPLGILTTRRQPAWRTGGAQAAEGRAQEVSAEGAGPRPHLLHGRRIMARPRAHRHACD